MKKKKDFLKDYIDDETDTDSVRRYLSFSILILKLLEVENVVVALGYSNLQVF